MNPEETLPYVKEIAIATFVLALVAFGIVSALLHYHWQTYGGEWRHLGRARLIYLGVAFFLIVAMGIVLGAYLL